MKIETTPLEGCIILTPEIYEDSRGYFQETFHARRFEKITQIPDQFVQDNESGSAAMVLRGLHFQVGEFAQAKLVRVVKGSVLDVCVDLRPNSATFKNWFSIVLSADNHKQMYIPRGFAHGFLSLEDNSLFAYKCDNYYNAKAERGIRFDDPDLNIDWRHDSKDLILSEKDLMLPTLKEVLDHV